MWLYLLCLLSCQEVIVSSKTASVNVLRSEANSCKRIPPEDPPLNAGSVLGHTCETDLGQMALLQANKDLISVGTKEFNILLNQQVFDHPLVTEEDMVVIVNDWVNMYVSFYRQQVTGEKEEQDRALQQLQLELKTLANPFLARYRAFLKSLEDSNRAVPSS